MVSQNTIDSIRMSSRQLVRNLGFMGGSFAGTDLSPSAVHALLEIEKGNCVTAKKLSERLQLEKSSISRLLRKLMAAGDIIEQPNPCDARSKQLVLTSGGKKRVIAINEYAQQQILQALTPLNKKQEQSIANGLKLYAEALSGTNSGKTEISEIEIIPGYQSGIIANITQMHATYYSREVGFGCAFESKVAAGLANFVPRLDSPKNEIWTANYRGEMVGSIAIDGEDLGDNKAHLRWFIVSDAARGVGVGHQLISKALAFVDDYGFDKTHLNTVEGLEAAHHLYYKYGFTCSHQNTGEQWGKKMVEQCFIR